MFHPKRSLLIVLLSLTLVCGLPLARLAPSLDAHFLAGTLGQAFASSSRPIYLTFDDGPNPIWTPRVLEILRRKHVHATFFVLGYEAVKYPAIIRQIHRDGHEIGNHGYYHTFIVNKSRAWVMSDVLRTDKAVASISGTKPQYFRPPGGILSLSDVGLISHIGHPIAMWTVDTNDWKAKNKASIVAAVRKNVKPGAIILLHDGISTTSRYTVQALPAIIDNLRNRGYSFYTLPPNYHGQFIGRPTDFTNWRFRTPK